MIREYAPITYLSLKRLILAKDLGEKYDFPNVFGSACIKNVLVKHLVKNMSMHGLEHELLERATEEEEETNGKERKKWKKFIDELESEQVQEEYSESAYWPGD